MQVDFIIVGRGICGTLLGWYLQKAGAKVVIIDNTNPSSASRIASGLINPVTGKRLVQSWMYQTLLPVAIATYREMEQQTGLTLLKELELLQFHATAEEEQLFFARAHEDDTYLHTGNERLWSEVFEIRYGIGAIDPCWLVNGSLLLDDKWRSGVVNLQNQTFTWNDCLIGNHSVKYQRYNASKIICCEGANGAANPYFALLPYALNKGEALIARIPQLPTSHIYQHGLKIVPWKEDLFWIGSSFEWKYEDLKTTNAFYKKTENVLKNWLKLPFEIVDHIAGERPSPVDYRPFVGLHPRCPEVGILNGMGTKGYLQAPYFAKCLAQHLINGSDLPADVDVNRFQKVLSRG